MKNCNKINQPSTHLITTLLIADNVQYTVSIIRCELFLLALSLCITGTCKRFAISTAGYRLGGSYSDILYQVIYRSKVSLVVLGTDTLQLIHKMIHMTRPL